MNAVEAHCTTHKDMIAADFMYHHSCMSRFMLSKLPADVEGNQNYDSTFVDLVTEISTKKRAVYYMTQVRDRYKDFRFRQTTETVHSYFGESMQIVSQRGESSHICSS